LTCRVHNAAKQNKDPRSKKTHLKFRTVQYVLLHACQYPPHTRTHIHTHASEARQTANDSSGVVSNLVLVTISLYLDTNTMSQAIAPATIVPRPIMPRLLPDTVPLVVLPLPFVNVSVLVRFLAVTFVGRAGVDFAQYRIACQSTWRITLTKRDVHDSSNAKIWQHVANRFHHHWPSWCDLWPAVTSCGQRWSVVARLQWLQPACLPPLVSGCSQHVYRYWPVAVASMSTALDQLWPEFAAMPRLQPACLFVACARIAPSL
jgi:hypothetical protein